MKPSRTGRSRKEKVALAKRRHLVSELYIQGYKQSAIGERVGVSQQTVSNDPAKFNARSIRLLLSRIDCNSLGVGVRIRRWLRCGFGL